MLLAGLSFTFGGEKDRHARRLAPRIGFGDWQHESRIPAEPQETPAMVIWEVSRFSPGGEPSPEQKRFSEDLVARSFAAAEKNGWMDFEKGTRAGYIKLFGDRHHYVNKEYILDDAILDPERPEFLMYYDRPEGKKLVGFMFLARKPDEKGPQVGGPRTVWHYHIWADKICLLNGLMVVGLPDEEGACTQGNPGHRSPEMMHIWLVDHPSGPFGTEMRIDPNLLGKLLEKRRAQRGY